jgi:hypothetical protein
MPRPYVDHKPPREAFRAALEGKLPHVLTVRAASGKGKSTLIGSFRQECKERGVPVGLLDFRALRGSDTFVVIGSIRYFLRVLDFPLYDASVAEYLKTPSPGVTLEDVHLTASNLGSITAGDPQRRRVVLSRLTDALLHDLEACCAKHCAVLLADTFEQADDEAKAWLTGQVVAGACDVTGLITVVAGQATPQIDPAHWQGIYRHFDLPTGLTWDDWQEYAQAVGALSVLTESTLRRYHEHYQGDPKFMCQICDPFLAEAA